MANYDLDCPLARTLDIIGERWTMLILRELFTVGPRRFQDFQDAFPAISPNTLSARLKRLEEHELVTRRFYDERPPRADYTLTDKGRTLGPIMKALREWGRTHTKV